MLASTPPGRRPARLAAIVVAVAALLPAAARADEFTANKFDGTNWVLDWGGYVHVSYRWVQQPDNLNLVGRNNGFQLEQARLGANVQYKSVLAMRVSFEGASEDRVMQSFPGGQLTARLRDAYITWAPLRALRVSLGQMETPWDLDSMRSSAELPFVTRAVPIEGVQPHEGRALRGLGVERNIGLMVHSGDLGLGSARALSTRYALFVGNGNGENQILNSNNKPAVFARVELAYWGRRGLPADRIGPMRSPIDGDRRPIVTAGLALQYNPRTSGNPPDLISETDVGGALDVAVLVRGVDFQAGFLYLDTMHDSLPGTKDLERYGWWAHLRYTIPRIPVEVTPGYRIASYSPKAHLFMSAPPGADAQVDGDLALLYHTIGVTVRPTYSFPVRLLVDYTVTQEKGANVLKNDRFEASAVAVF